MFSVIFKRFLNQAKWGRDFSSLQMCIQYFASKMMWFVTLFISFSVKIPKIICELSNFSMPYGCNSSVTFFQDVVIF